MSLWTTNEPWILDAGTIAGHLRYRYCVQPGWFHFDIFDVAKFTTLPVCRPDKLIPRSQIYGTYAASRASVGADWALEYTAVSKYVLCYEKTAYKRLQLLVRP